MPIASRTPLAGLIHKLKRFSTSLLPIDAGRRGSCNRCGECCKLPFPCPFLRYDSDGLSTCAVYHARPPSCRKYPRTANEHITPDTCSYYFVDVKDIGMAISSPRPEQAGG
jgi:Fe-S-cluster containining protein